MHFEHIITPERIACDADIGSKKRVLDLLSELLSKGLDRTPTEIFNCLVERERLGSTGLGQGVALPHGRMGNATGIIGAFVKLKSGIDFDSPDGEATDLLFALLVPQDHDNEHLQVLAALAQLFSNKEFCAKVRAAQSSEEILDIFRDYQTLIASAHQYEA